MMLSVYNTLNDLFKDMKEHIRLSNYQTATKLYTIIYSFIKENMYTELPTPEEFYKLLLNNEEKVYEVLGSVLTDLRKCEMTDINLVLMRFTPEVRINLKGEGADAEVKDI